MTTWEDARWRDGDCQPDPYIDQLEADIGQLPAHTTPWPPVSITVHGRPAPQGSKKGFAIKKGGEYTGHVAMQEQTAKHLTPWREAVKQAGLAAMNWGQRPPLDGPLEAAMVFTFTRPRSHYGTGRNARQLKPGAPARPAVYPDLSKILRSTEDALKDAGVIKDDSRVVEYARLAKVYCGEDPDALLSPGCVITIRQITT